MIIPYIMENKKCSKPPTRYDLRYDLGILTGDGKLILRLLRI